MNKYIGTAKFEKPRQRGPSIKTTVQYRGRTHDDVRAKAERDVSFYGQLMNLKVESIEVEVTV